MQHVDEGNDESQPRLQDRDHPPETEQDALLILLDDTQRQTEQDQEQRHDSDGDEVEHCESVRRRDSGLLNPAWIASRV